MTAVALSAKATKLMKLCDAAGFNCIDDLLAAAITPVVPVANVIRLASDAESGDVVARCGMLAKCSGRCSSGCSDPGRHSKPRTWPRVSRSLSCNAPRRRGSASMLSTG